MCKLLCIYTGYYMCNRKKQLSLNIPIKWSVTRCQKEKNYHKYKKMCSKLK